MRVRSTQLRLFVFQCKLCDDIIIYLPPIISKNNKTYINRGVFRGGAFPPPFVTWAEGLSTQTVGEDLCLWPAPNFGPKTGFNLSEDLFFYLHLILGKKNGLNLSEDLFFYFFIFGNHLFLGGKTL